MSWTLFFILLMSFIIIIITYIQFAFNVLKICELKNMSCWSPYVYIWMFTVALDR